MDSLHHDRQSQNPGHLAAAWTPINRQLSRKNKPMDVSSGGLGATQSTSPTTPATKTGGNPYKTPVTGGPRPLLPRVPRPLPLPAFRPLSSSRACPVCGRTDCTLRSHRHYAENVTVRQRARNSLQSPRQSDPASLNAAQPRPFADAVHYPVAMDSERHRLLSLWSQNWGRSSEGFERHLFPVKWIDLVLPTAMTHAVLFQALLATVASMWEMTRTNMNLSESARGHLRLADQMLEQTCANQHIASQDECILAALLLVTVYLAQGDDRETDQRFSQLVRLVHFRGGPHYLGISGVVADVLLYVDYFQAVLLNCEPVWKMHLPALQIGLPPRLGAGFRALMSSNVFQVDLLLAADSICRTADIFEQPLEAQSSASGPTNAFGYLSMVSEYQLAHHNAVLHNSNTWNECMCLGLLLFDHMVLRSDGLVTASARRIEQQFWQTVDSTISREGFLDVPPCLLLWLFITGLSSCVLSDCPYRLAAITRMRGVRIHAAINGWEHFRHKVLDDFVWMRTVQEEAFRDVWLEVEGYRTAP